MRLLPFCLVLGCLFWTSVYAVCPLQGQTVSLATLLDRANAAQSAEKYAEAAALYSRATALSPRTPELWSNRGVMEYLAGETDPAISSLNHALRLNPALYVPMLFLGKAYVKTGRPTLAVPYLAHAHQVQPSDTEVLLTLAKAYAETKQSREAETTYSEAARAVPDNATAWLGLGSASLEVIAGDGQTMASSQTQSIWARALFADELLAQGRPLEATDEYHTALSGASAGDKATLAQMLDWLQSHPDLFPLPASSEEALSKLHDQLRPERSETALPPCDPSVSDLQAAACSFWTGEYQRSAELAGQALKTNPRNSEALYWSVKSNERIAVAALGRFEVLAPRSAASYVLVGDLFRDQRQMDNALDSYKKALAIDPHDSGALLGAIVASLAGSKLDEAADLDRTALTDHPLDPQFNLLMAEILASENRYSEAKPFLAKCSAAPAEMQSRVHFLQGRADAEEGRNEEAIREYVLALPGDKDGSIHFQLSRLYRKTGSTVLAQKAETEAKAILSQRRASAMIEVREATGQTSTP